MIDQIREDDMVIYDNSELKEPWLGCNQALRENRRTREISNA